MLGNIGLEGDQIAGLVVELGSPEMCEEDGVYRPRARASLSFRPPGGESEIKGRSFSFTAPIGPMEAGELAWYLEKWAQWPSEHLRERAGRVEDQLVEWGRRLWLCLETEAARAPLQAWNSAPDRGWARELTIDVSESLDGYSETAEAANLLLALPWELIHDGDGYLQHHQGGMRLRRRRSTKNKYTVVREPTELPIRILLVSPRPEDEKVSYFDHRISARPLVEALQPLGELVELDILEPPTFKALSQRLKLRADQGRPYHVVHFDGHGSYKREVSEIGKQGVLYFEAALTDDLLLGRIHQSVAGDQLADLLREHATPIFFLEACQSAQSHEHPDASVATQLLLKGGVSSVVAMTHSVLFETSRRFVTVFYRELMAGHPVSAAVLAGQRELATDRFRRKTFAGDLGLNDWFVPVLFQTEHDPRLFDSSVPSELARAETAEERRSALHGLPEPPMHSFLGRSRELLSLERLLVHEPYAVVLGVGGEGKTTLACELAYWLVVTNRARRAAFVSLEVNRFPKAVLSAIGAQLVPSFASVVAQNPEDGILRLEEALIEQKTVVVVDNCESVLPAMPGTVDEGVDEPEASAQIFALLERLANAGETRLIFTSRTALPAPFSTHSIEIEQLDEDSAIELVGRALAEGNQRPGTSGGDDDVVELVNSVGRHARSLVLLAGELAARGVGTTTVALKELMAALSEQHPDDRERSLYASVELSLRRLPEATRSRIGPLSVFRGGGNFVSLGLVLETDLDEARSVARELVAVGLARDLGDSYFAFHPALTPYLASSFDEGDYARARERWAEAVTQLIGFLYLSNRSTLVARLTLFELPNLLGGLDYLRNAVEPTALVESAIRLELLLSALNRPRALARVVRIREQAAAALTIPCHATCQAESSAIDRLLDWGRFDQAIERAEILCAQIDEAGDTFPEAAYDRAMARSALGRARKRATRSLEAIAPLKEACEAFERLAEAGDRAATRMASVCLMETGECLLEVGRLEEAASTLERMIGRSIELGEERDLAAGRGLLGEVRLAQSRYAEAHDLLQEARSKFSELEEPRAVASLCHKIGMLYRATDQYDMAEASYQEALELESRIGNRAGEGATLHELATLFAESGRLEEAASFQRRAVTIFHGLGDIASEGRTRSSLARALWMLGRPEEARVEINRAIECDGRSDHSTEPWVSYDTLQKIEFALGNITAALEARRRATEAYRTYRQDGGEPRFPGGGICRLIAKDMAQKDFLRARAGLNSLRRAHDCPLDIFALVPVLESVLAGNRDSSLIDDPELAYHDAVEVRILLKELAATESSD